MMSQDGVPIPSTVKGLAQQQPNPNPNPLKKKRNFPGTPDPDAEVIAMSPKSLMATNRFMCEICNKGFQRDQNLQLHRRGHNLPWKLKQRTNKEVRKKVYICPEKTCVHHDPSRALGDLTGIKKHFSRKHGEKKWKCEKCSKKYAVQSDWKAHSKICGTREYRCDCGTLFSRKDSFITHRAFCDALAEESARFTSVPSTVNPVAAFTNDMHQFSSVFKPEFSGGLELVNNLNPNGQKPQSRLQLWLDQGNPFGVPNNTTANAFLASKSTSLPDLGMAPMNMFGLSFPGANLNMSALRPKQEEENKGDLSESITSLYSNNNLQQSESHSHMSATALLQKAAQMGSTRSNPAAFNNSGFRLMSSNNTYDQSKNEVYKLFKQANDGESENINKLVSSLSSTQAAVTKDGCASLDDLNSSSFVRNATTKQGNNSNEVDSSLTRDFLGVGGESNRSFLQQQELVKFASMGSIQQWN
ncbi:zinc finger protein BALDIBIS-like isoform X2 [Hibiscus syriacus]|uniref:zinc finger protein BALDIBIS-like isoform X2 n=1 Tax=Hibiscus syriacus TaxID=106335 RepID=UPI0019237A69|nr:zinc finger protein BALDIBIS-like isoform X2 [Hibiscus syriacus]